MTRYKPRISPIIPMTKEKVSKGGLVYNPPECGMTIDNSDIIPMTPEVIIDRRHYWDKDKKEDKKEDKKDE